MKADHATPSAENNRLADRRDFMRLDKSGRGLLRLRGEAHPVGSGKIIDISANGLSLCCDIDWAARVTPGTPVEIVARLDEANEPFYLIGEVIWVRELAAGKCQIGIELPLADDNGETTSHDNRDWRALFLA